MVHIELKEDKHYNDQEENALDEFADDAEDATHQMHERQHVESLNEHWLSLEPSQADFAALLREALQDEGLECLKKFERYSRHEELLPYVRVLESWDDRVCEGEWEDLPDDYHLRCDEWL